MRDRFGIWLFAMALICATFAGAYFGARSFLAPEQKTHAQIAQASNPNQAGDQNKNPSAVEAWWRWTTNDATGFYTLLLVIGTAILAGITGALAVFTYRLWSSGEKTTKQRDRAYITGGGPLLTQSIKDGGEPSTDYWMMVISNHGKTIGFVTSVEWGLYPYSDFPKGVPISKIIDDQLLPVNTVKKVAYPDNIFPPSETHTPYRHVVFKLNEAIGCVFFARIRFNDIFGDPHHSTFKLLIVETGSETLEGGYSTDWS